MLKNKDYLIISIVTIVTILAWIMLDTYHAASTSTITSVQQQLVEPLDPKFDESVIQNIQNRIKR